MREVEWQWLQRLRYSFRQAAVKVSSLRSSCWIVKLRILLPAFICGAGKQNAPLCHTKQQFLKRSFVGAFPELRKATASLSVCPYGTAGLPGDGFLWNLMFDIFSKICTKFEILCIKIQNILRADNGPPQAVWLLRYERRLASLLDTDCNALKLL